MSESTPNPNRRPIGTGPSGKGLHGLGPAPEPGASGRFGTLLLVLAAVPFALGLWGTAQGLLTLGWPRADGLIEYASLSVSEADDRGRTSASISIRYSYVVDGKSHSGSAIAPYTFGMQNSAQARAQHDRYARDMPVKVAYDPSDPSIAYLEPGPSSTSLMLVAVGLIIGLTGLLIKRLAAAEKRAAARGGSD
jgi:hypothetical protein